MPASPDRARRRPTAPREPRQPAGPTATDRGITATTDDSGRVHGVADILCDGTGPLGSLSYTVPATMTVTVGDAVHVPFGTRRVHGIVLGPGDPGKATRDILSVHGRRANPKDIAVARHLAELNFGTLEQIAVRLAPRTGRGHEPASTGPVTLHPAPPIRQPHIDDRVLRRMLIRAPLIDPAHLAATEAHRMAQAGQVLILCPTVELVGRVMDRFTGGAARVDTKADPGNWRGFCEGTVTVAVGTRTAALYSAANLAGIIVVEEDHPGHVEATQPYTHARDVAAARATALGAALTLITANPTPAGIGAQVKVYQAGSSRDWPRVWLIDRDDFHPTDRIVPPPLHTMLRKAVSEGHRPAVVCSPRKAVRRCTRCHTARPCTECTSSLCRHTGNPPCPVCEHDQTRVYGWDTERIRAKVGRGVQIIPANKITDAALTTDTGGPRTVAVLGVDSALNAPGFEPDALAGHILTAAARLAGPGGTLAVCTDEPEHPLLQDLCVRRDQLTAARRAWDTARQAGLPPFGRLVTVRCGQDTEPQVERWPGQVFGPRHNGTEWEVLVKTDDRTLPYLRPSIERLRRRGKVRVAVT
jgi:primosomal protein N'